MERFDYPGLLIGGRWRAASDGGTIEVADPATEDTIGLAPQATEADTRSAIDAACAAFEAWRATDPWARSAALRRVADLLRARVDDLAAWITRETGKPLGQSRGEAATAADYFDWFADEARRIYGTTIPARDGRTRLLVGREPVGPVAVLTSWNFPINLPARKIAAALAAGCTVVCRPSEEAPGAAMALFACLAEAGLPAGAVNLLTGLHGPIVPALMADPRIRKVSFTGSTAVGQRLMAEAAPTVKRLSLELGGHAPAIVFEDADVAVAARELTGFKFRNAGQICISPSRFYVHEAVEEAFTAAVLDEVGRLKVGNGFDPATDVGPLINARRVGAVEGLVAEALARDAALRAGGRRAAEPNRGHFFEPTVLTGVPDEARVMTEEPFGPIVPITTFSGFDEVIRRGNALEYGLAGYVYTRSLARAHEAVAALDLGMVGVNTALVAAVEAPFGGVKQSGFGSEGGAEGIDAYLATKYAKLALGAA